MKKIFILTAAISLCYTNLTAQSVSQKDNAFLDNLFRSNLVINKERITSDTIAMVFKGTFYMVDPKIKLADTNDVYSCRQMINIADAVIYDRLDTGLFLLAKDNFYLKTEKDVLIFEGALDKLYPITDPEDLASKKHLKTGNDWCFVRGEFFDSKSGFRVTIDKNGKITGIVYDIELIKGK
jgi:hypothetical protein